MIFNFDGWFGLLRYVGVLALRFSFGYSCLSFPGGVGCLWLMFAAAVVCCDCASCLLCAAVQVVVVLVCVVVFVAGFGCFWCSGGLVCLFACVGVLGGVWFGGGTGYLAWFCDVVSGCVVVLDGALGLFCGGGWCRCGLF